MFVISGGFSGFDRVLWRFAGEKPGVFFICFIRMAFYFVHFEIYPGVSILFPKPFPLSIPGIHFDRKTMFEVRIYKFIKMQ